MKVTPITVTSINWEVASQMIGDPQLISKLSRLGVKQYDPAALSILLAGKTDLADSWTLKFAFVGFLITGTPFENKGMILDCAELADNSYVLTGTADKWLHQILKESSIGNSVPRINLFNKCYEHLLNTSLKTMFYNYERKHVDQSHYVLVRKVK